MDDFLAFLSESPYDNFLIFYPKADSLKISHRDWPDIIVNATISRTIFQGNIVTTVKMNEDDNFVFYNSEDTEVFKAPFYYLRTVSAFCIPIDSISEDAYEEFKQTLFSANWQLFYMRKQGSINYEIGGN